MPGRPAFEAHAPCNEIVGGGRGPIGRFTTNRQDVLLGHSNWLAVAFQIGRDVVSLYSAGNGQLPALNLDAQTAQRWRPTAGCCVPAQNHLFGKERQDMRLQGPRVTIRPMIQADINAMAKWRPFADPLYQAFDFPKRSLNEHRRWFEWRSNDESRRLYTVEDAERHVIGSLTLREIDGRRSARLGITIGADYVSHHYGSEALQLFLEYYFETMGFATMVLDVAATNLRAVRTYVALGFRHTGQHYRPASHPSFRTLRQDPQYSHLHHLFRRQGTAHMVLFYDMALTREEWRLVTGMAGDTTESPPLPEANTHHR